MLYDELWETALRNGWQLATVEDKVLPVGAFLVAAVLTWDGIRIWKRMRRVEIELRRLEKKIYILEMQESGRLTRLVRELNAKSRVKIETGDGKDTAPTISLPATADQRENGKSTKLACRRRRVLRRKTVAQA
jgi:hypothetical protein